MDIQPCPLRTVSAQNKDSLTRFAWLSIAASLITMALKVGAYTVTFSVGLLSDAAESLVNLAAGIIMLVALRIASRPPDENHRYGHEKAEYFSSGAEGTLITIAAAAITFKAIERLVTPHAIEQLGLGLGILVLATLVNVAAAQVLLRAGRRHGSIALEANGRHLMTDVWTSVGVLVGLGSVAFTGWDVLDPLVALAIAGHIGWTGYRLIRRSALGLMDTAFPAHDLEKVTAILAEYARRGLRYHALRTRRAGRRGFVEVHIQVPGAWSVQKGHDMLEEVERGIRNAVPNTAVITHLEPLEDPKSWEDEDLDRPLPPERGRG